MNGESQSQIAKFLFNLSHQEYSKSDKDLKNIVIEKVKARCKAATEKILKKKQ